MSGNSQDTVRILSGYRQDTVKIQSGYNLGTVRIQSEYSQDTALVELRGYNQNTEWDTVRDTIGIQSRIQSGYRFG